MRSWVWLLLPLLLAGPLTAQGTVGETAQGAQRTCDTAERANFRRIRNSQGEETVYIQGPTRFLCTGGVEVRADSAVWRRTTGELELIRHVFYQDSTRTLRADWANFLGNTSTLYARGSIVLTDLESESVVRGQRLQYEQETAERPVARAIVEGGRPHATLHPAGDSTLSTGQAFGERGRMRNDTTPPIEVDANWMEFLGTGLFRAKDDVVIVRAGTDAYADSAEFDQAGGRLSLRRAARVVDPQYRLAADSIDAYLTENALRDVEAVGDVRLHSEDLQVTAPRVSIGFLGGQFQDMRAWVPGRLAVLAAASSSGAEAVGRDTLRARADTVGPPPGVRPDTAQPLPARPPSAGVDSVRGKPLPPVADTAGVLPSPAPDTATPDTMVAVDTVGTVGVPSPPTLPPGAPAARWGADTTYADSVQAVATAKEFRLEADSIHAIAPDQQLDRVVAIGQGYGERLGDSLGVNLPLLAAHDWVRGDTIIGYFAADTTAAARPDSSRDRTALMRRRALGGDTARASRPDSTNQAEDSTVQRTLKRVVVVGGTQPARSLYRIRPQDTKSVEPGRPPPAKPAVADTAAMDTAAVDSAAADSTGVGSKSGINYMTARRITLHFKNGEVERVEAEGPIEGLYLDPNKKPEPSDTTAAPKVANPNG